MDEKAYFIKTVKCPVCKEKVDCVIVKSSATRMIKRDEDFCPHFEPINRVLYNVWICSECGYTAMTDKFETISDKEIKLIKEEIKKKWTKRDFSGERTNKMALDIYKLALLNLEVMGAKSSEIAKVCIRIAWIYRYMEDEREKVFLKYALDNYLQVYQNEKFPVDKLDERTCMYMIGELHKRLGENEEAAKWFYNVISFRNEKESASDKAKSKNIVDMARDQLQSVREAK